MGDESGRRCETELNGIIDALNWGLEDWAII